MEYANRRALRHTFSLFLLGLVLLLLGYALYMISDGLSRLPQAEGAVGDNRIPLEVVATLVGAFVGVVGLMVTSVWNWREDRRREMSFALTMERQRLEIEKLKLQLAMLQGGPVEGGAGRPSG